MSLHRFLKSQKYILKIVRYRYTIPNYRCFSAVYTKEDSTATNESVADFYAGKSVLITGGTGFVGKAITEKLLFSCEKLDKIYLLIREKDDLTANERLNKMFETALYDRLRKKDPSVLKKVIPITSDITKPKLGIKPNDEIKIINDVSVVLHMAATINFGSRLSTCVKVNVEGTRKLLELSNRIKNIQSLVYSSTAFAHPHMKILSEIIYHSPAKLEDVYRYIEKYSHDKNETKKMLNGKPNGYIFSKALAEAYVAENHGNIPTAIVRPSLVVAAMNEPAKGWIDCLQAGIFLMDSAGSGLIRVLRTKESNVLDIIPVDYVANATIIVAARNTSGKLKVYNFSSSYDNPVTYKLIGGQFINETMRLKRNIFPYPFIYYTDSKTIQYILTAVLQILPAQIADLYLRMQGKDPKYMKLMKSVIMTQHFFEFFIHTSWSVKADNIRNLLHTLSPAEQRMFPCDPVQIDWSVFMKDFRKGSYKYLLKN